jgi:hypothetical protein
MRKISYPLYRQKSADVAVAARRMVEQVPHRLRRLAKGRFEVAPTRAAISGGGLEGGPTAMTAGAACFFPTCYSSPFGNGDDEE